MSGDPIYGDSEERKDALIERFWDWVDEDEDYSPGRLRAALIAVVAITPTHSLEIVVDELTREGVMDDLTRDVLLNKAAKELDEDEYQALGGHLDEEE